MTWQNRRWSTIPTLPSFIIRTQWTENSWYKWDNKLLIIGCSGSEKTNALLNLINNEPEIDKIYLCAKDPYAAKYQYLIKKREKVGVKH